MTTAKTFRYTTALSRKVVVPGGIKVSEAIAQAQTNLEQHKDAAMVTVNEGIEALESVCDAQAPGSEAEVYQRAAALLDMAGFFETGPLYTAAFSLCELADGMLDASCWSWPPIRVHVQAMRVIFSADCRETQETALVLQGLAAVLGRCKPKA